MTTDCAVPGHHVHLHRRWSSLTGEELAPLLVQCNPPTKTNPEPRDLRGSTDSEENA